MAQARLTEIELPDFGMPDAMPQIPAATYGARLAALRERADGRYDRVVVYADREHSANLAFLTGFDPRFEEAILVVGPIGEPAILVGNECFGMAGAAPLAMRRHLFQDLSLTGQPRDRSRPLSEILTDEGVRAGSRIGVVGWKSYASRALIEAPAFIVDELRRIVGPGGTVENATDLLIDAADGLRAINDVDQLAAFEYAACQTSQGVRRLLSGLRPGLSEREAVRLLEWDGTPLSCHLMLSSGPRATLGLLSPGDRRIERGDRFTVAFGIWGALNCRAGFVVEDAAGLPSGIGDYVDRLVGPYFAAVAEWYAALRVGQTGGTLQEIIDRHLGDPFFGIFLNPGHQIHLDEWLNSPIAPGFADRAPLGDGPPGGHHPGHRDRLLHHQHRGRPGPRGSGAARSVRDGLPGRLGADPGTAPVHGRVARDRPPPRRAAVLQPAGLSRTLPAPSGPGHDRRRLAGRRGDP